MPRYYAKVRREYEGFFDAEDDRDAKEQAWLVTEGQEATKEEIVEVKKAFWVRVYARGDDGEIFNLGEVDVVADTEEQAKKLAMDELWDNRLDSASCVPIVEIEE